MSLVEIKKATRADLAVLQLHRLDTVAIALAPLSPGREVAVDGRAFTVREVIPIGHKVALREIRAGEVVLRYGQAIGRATQSIAQGSHVHTHNVGFEEIAFQYEFPEVDRVPLEPTGHATFMGYARPDGRVGTRNFVAVVAASNCAAHTSDAIAASYAGQTLPAGVDGVVSFPHGEGCGHTIGPDTVQLQRTLGGVLDHPNVSAAIVLGLGCEVNQIEHYLGPGAKDTDRLVGLTLQASGGTAATVQAARGAISKFLERAADEKRTEVSASKIVLGLNCGGSDSFSGITANPALGYCSDLIAKFGGTTVLAETPEIIGAEHLLIRRARNREVALQLLGQITFYKEYLRNFGGSFDDNPSPGNKAGGLTNILEKSLGAVAKSGTSLMNEVVGYAEPVHGPGLVFMNTPGYDPVSLTGLAAGGVNLIAFTTGRGSGIGFPTIPVLKIASNSDMYGRMQDNMDINAGRIADGEAGLEEIGKEILERLLRVASGERTASERLGHREFVPWRIGPVL